ncbi:hypothetical protein APHAL10511_005050 [Amanita phalloides]|nr:hypothetical protein APHAL10511_005050 [Amanita phalloides]
MDFADIDTNDGYWGDDDINEETSESDLPSSSSSLGSRTRMTDASMTPPAVKKQRDFPETPSRQSQQRNMPAVFTGFSNSFKTPSSSDHPPNTPESRRKHILKACEETSLNDWTAPAPLSPTTKKSAKPVARTQSTDTFNDIDEEREVLTDTEPSHDPPMTLSSSSSFNLRLKSEGSFSSVTSGSPQLSPTRRPQRSDIMMASPSGRSDVSMKSATPQKSPFPRRPEMAHFGTPSPSNTFEFALGTKLDVIIIAHNREVQQQMDALNISWGVQYELARGVTVGSWPWSDVRAKLEKLQGINTQTAYRVSYIMRNRPINDRKALPLWLELDREQDAIMEGKGRGLGLMGPWQGDPDWYGGRIQQVVRLYKDNDQIRIKLEPMEIRKSHRFARYCGSRRILQARIPDDIGDSEDIRDFLTHKFVLCGRVFVPFHAKEGTVYMVEINENYERQSRNECGDQHRLPFVSFINWHNPLARNKSQVINKYANRFGLGLSNSVPVIEFQEDRIQFLGDQVASGWDENVKPPSEKIMTDGCGFINRAGMVEITRRMKYGSRPTAVQGRIGGAKGLWTLDPSYDQDHLPRIWIRDSQNKIKYENFKDRSHRIFELLSVSQPSPPIAITSQPILNMSFNGVPEATLIKLLEKSIADEVDPLMDWSKPMVYLWDAICKAGHVSSARAQRYAAAGKSRALGLSHQEWGPKFLRNDEVLAEERAFDDTMDMDVDVDLTGGVYTGRNKYSGMPLSSQECAAELIQAGFKPTELEPLRDKIRFIVQNVIDAAVEDYRIKLQESISALVIPDPINVLGEGEIYYRSSQALKDPATETMFFVLTGPVLIGRYPVRIDCDMQKVIAVDRPGLSEWSDVVIVSTKGEQSPASILAGGDYDGDQLFVIREAPLVEPFDNKPFTPEPKNLRAECFNIDAETLDNFMQRTVVLSPGYSQREFQRALLSGLTEFQKGLYSNFHEYATFKYGYQHIDTIRMAYMFSITLDAGKTGLRVKPEVFKRHRARFNGEIPSNAEFILNHLKAAALRKGDELLCDYDKIKAKDMLEDLKRPWDDAFALARRFEGERNDAVFREEMRMIMDHVNNAYQEWLSVCRKRKEKTKLRHKKNRKSREAGEDIMLNVARMYKEGPDVCFLQNVEQLKASYACALNVQFALTVAFGAVCDMKVRASADGYASSTRIFDEMKTMSLSSLRALVPTDNNPF